MAASSLFANFCVLKNIFCHNAWSFWRLSREFLHRRPSRNTESTSYTDQLLLTWGDVLGCSSDSKERWRVTPGSGDRYSKSQSGCLSNFSDARLGCRIARGPPASHGAHDAVGFWGGHCVRGIMACSKLPHCHWLRSSLGQGRSWDTPPPGLLLIPKKDIQGWHTDVCGG